MSLRTRRGLVSVASLMLVVTACGGGAPTTTPGGGAATQAPTAAGTEPAATGGAPTGGAATPAGTAAAESQPIRYAVDGEMTFLSNANSDVPTSEAVQWLYSALYRYNERLEPVPDLAASEATISADGLTWTIDLVPNGTFQPTGEKVTADDVVFTYEMANSPNCRFNPSLCLANVLVDATPEEEGDENVPVLKGVRAVDEDTVEFTLAAPYAPFSTVSLPGIYIDSRKAVTESFERFQERAREVPDRQITQLSDEITAEAEKEEPNTIRFRQQLEQLLDRAGIQRPQPDANAFPATDEEGNPTGELDEAAYVDALIVLFNDLAATVAAGANDKIAAAYPLLDIQRRPVGAGPFYLTDFKPGQSLTYARNDQYHHGPPQVPQMFVPIIKDEVAAASALNGGDIDWKYSMAADAYNAVKDNQDVKIAEYPDFGYYGLQYNLREGRLFADKAVRQAVAYCIDKAATVEAATDGQGIPVEADIPPASWAYNPNLPTYENDPAKGKQLLEQAGWTMGADGVYEKDGQKLGTLILVRAGKPDRIKFMELLRDQVNENCGFALRIQEADFATVLLPMLEFPHVAPGTKEPFDAYFGGWGTSFDPDPYSIWHSSQCTTKDQPDTYNYICFENERVDEIIEQGLRELDQEKRKELYFEFQEILVEEQPYLFAWSDIAREGLRGSINTTEGELTAENMGTPTFFWQVEKLTNTAAAR